MTNKQANSIGTATMLLVAIIIMLLVMCSCNSNTTQEQHNFDAFDITFILSDTIYDDEDMNCGDDDSLPNYNSFINVPAGIEDTIIVNEIMYKMNNNKTLWIPIYPDEDVMWITGNGDTIWE